MRHRIATRAAAGGACALLLGLALAGCEARSYDLPGGGSISLDPNKPVDDNLDTSNARACMARDHKGRASLVARSACAGRDTDGDGVIRRW